MPQPTSPKIPFPPPLIYVGGFGIGWMLWRTWRVELLPDEFQKFAVLGGWMLIILGFAIMSTGLLAFVIARTGIMPNLPASRLLTTGAYRFSRNPMYVGLTIANVGGILLTNIAWCLLIFVVVLVVFQKVIIPREERYLFATFGEEYAQYCAKVRRWV